MKAHPIWRKNTHQKFGVTSCHIRCSRRDKRSIPYVVCIARFFFYSVVLGLHFLAQVIPEVLTIVLPCSVLDSAK